MKPRTEQAQRRRVKLPPILEIDEDGIPVNEMENWQRPRWTSDDGDAPGLTLDDWPAEFDD
jgi:hypothetical protein